MKATDATLTVDTLFSDPVHYKQALENNTVAFILGINGKTILCNEAAAQLFGYSTEEFTGIHRDQLFVNDNAYHAALYKRSIGEHKASELTGIKKDGTHFFCEVYSSLFTDEDGIVKSSTSVIELSRYKELELKSQLSDLLLNNIDQSFLLIDEKLSIINFTLAARRGLKDILDIDIAPGDPVLKIEPEERQNVLRKYFELAFAGEQPVYHTHYETGGKLLFFEYKFKPVFNQQHTIHTVLLTIVNITEQVLAETALEQTERRWRFALEGSNQGVWDWDIPSGKTYYSPTWKKALGFDETDVFNDINDWKRLLHPDDRLKMDKEIDLHLVSENAHHESIHRLRSKNGEYRWILARGMIVSYNELNEPVRMIGTHTDITDQKSIQQGYQHLFYNHPLPMWIYDIETLKIEEVNEAALIHYGYSKKEFLSLTIEQLRPKEDINILHKYINQLKPDVTAKYIVRHKKKDGSIIFSEVVGNHLEYNGRRCRMISANDVTQTIITENELRNSNERFELAAKATSDIVWDWDLQQNQIELADNYTISFGIIIPEDKKIKPDSFTERIHPDDRRKWKSNITAILINPKYVKFEEEFRFRRSDDTYAFIIVRGYILRDEKGKATRIIGAISDISEKKYNQELLSLELRVFETSAIQNISFQNVLKTFLQGFEYLHPEINSVLLLQEESAKTLVGPKGFSQLAEPINETINSQIQRGTGSYSKKQLLVSDLSDTTWETCRDIIVANDWKICWVIPVQHASGSDLAYFTLFLKEAQVPSEEQLNILLRLRNLLRILIINNQSIKQVRTSNERYDMVLKATHDMIWDWNLEQDNFYRNEEGLWKVYGIADHRQIQNNDDWLKRIHPEDQDRVACIINNIIKSVELDKFEIEYRFKRDDGTYSHVYDRGIVIKDEAGKPYRLIGAAQNISERKKLEEELVKKELERQKAINQASVDSQEHERREIGRELHDNVNQILTTTRLYLDLSLTNQDMKDELILKSSTNINHVINEIRQLSRSLMDPSLGDLGLIDSLNDLIESINITKKLSVSLHADCNLDNYIEPNQRLAVFRIVQEALSNIIKHAQATKTFIRLSRKKQAIELKIRDNGKGFDIQTVKKGAGIKNIQNRVYLMNGLITIDAAFGKGCSLNIQFPINQTN